MKNRAHRRIAVLAALAIVTFSLPAAAADGDGFTRGNGVIARIGAGAPANLNLGAGYRFNSHFALAMEAFSYSGLTTLAGAVDARYHVLDNALTPFISAKIGYGSLGKTLEYKDYKDLLYAWTAGISWRGFDLGAGIIYDSFHQLGFTANLSWTYCFRIK